jgi:uncharacterized delta-60 repeat protein
MRPASSRSRSVTRRGMAFRAALAVLVGAAASLGSAVAQTPFGDDGRLVLAFQDFPSAIGLDLAIDPEDRIVVSTQLGTMFGKHGGGKEEFGVLRLLPDGQPDPSFGTGGEAAPGFAAASFGVVGALALDDAGRAVVAGLPEVPGANLFGVLRFTPTGLKDAGFGMAGEAMVDFPPADAAFVEDVMVASNGRIVAVGKQGALHPPVRFALARLRADGTLDPAFGVGGRVTTEFPTHPQWSEAAAVAEDSAMRVIAAGHVLDPDDVATTIAMAVSRYRVNGQLDVGFGTDGRVVVEFDMVSQAQAVVVDDQDRVIAGGCVLVPGFKAQGFALARLNTDGSLDESFGEDGRVVTPIDGSGCINDLAIDTEDRIVAAGWVDVDGAGQRFALARYRPDGSLDAGFGDGGTVTTTFPDQSNSFGEAVDIDGEGRIFVAGSMTRSLESGAGPTERGRVAIACYRDTGALCRPINFEYAAKVVCGRQEDPDNLALVRGVYGTTVNVHNPHRETARFSKKLALSIPPLDQRPGRILEIAEDALDYDEALATHCTDLQRRLFPDGFPGGFIEGFVVIQSTHSLDVAAVYTAGSLSRDGGFVSHSSIHVERVPERRLGREDAPLPDLVPLPALPPPPFDAEFQVQLPEGVPGALYCGEKPAAGGPSRSVVVLVRNQGLGDAGPSVTQADFHAHGAVSTVTPALAAGEETVVEFDIPSGCYGPGFSGSCSFTFTVDHTEIVQESDELNNTASSLCLSPAG